MDNDKRTIIGLLLIGLVIIFTYSDFYRKLVYNEQPGQAQKIEPQESAPAAVPDSLQPPRTARGVAERRDESSQVASGRQEPSSLQQRIFQDFNLATAAEEEKVIRIETPIYIAEISSRGPSISSWTLKNYLGPDSLPHQLILEKEGNLSLSLPVQGDTLSLARSIFQYEGSAENHSLSASNSAVKLPFRLALGEGKAIHQTLTFFYDKYSIDMQVQLEGLEEFVDGYIYSINWPGGLRTSEAYLKEDMQYAKAYGLTAEDLEEFDVKNEARATDEIDGVIKWGAVRTKYFTAAIVPKNQAGAGIKFVGESVPITPEEKLKKYGIAVHMPYYRKKTTDAFTVYLGPLQYSIVKSYGVNLERMMNFGWAIIRPISKGVLWCLTMLFGIIPNYGMVIVVFSILVKILVYPLTKKSYQSMKQMQKVQPIMQEIREKYKDDPQRMNQEVMKLYREHGVNPLGGCLPMLLQMPLLYALFIIFRSTIELRGAPFFGWITDLSRPDTIFTLPFSIPFYGDGVNVLPLFMGVTMFLQQKMTVQDPKQKAMVYFMPVFFTFLFNTFPSGLNLYYSLFNVFTIIQQKLISTDAAGPESNGKLKKKKRPRSRIDAMRQQVRGRRKV